MKNEAPAQKFLGIHGAKWVGADTEAVPIFRMTLDVKEPRGAYIDVCGLGFFEMFVDGKKVSDELLVPSQSDYGKRDLSTLVYPLSDTFSYRVYFRHYALDSYLVPGTNIIEFMLGDGWFRQTVRTAEGKVSYGDPRLIFSLVADGVEHLSDESLVWRESHIVKQNLFVGEVHDFRHVDNEWKSVRLMPAPGGKLMPDFPLSDRVIRRITPRKVFEDGSRTIYDAGENIAGVVAFTQPAELGAETVVCHVEGIYPDGTLYPHDYGHLQVDRYINDGKERYCCPQFVFHGFRYFEVKGRIENPEVLVIHSDIPVTSSFSSSNKVLNWLYDATVRSLLSNMHSGVISDCPHRERLGYTGDGQLSCDAAMTLLSPRYLYEKWLGDIADGQDPVSGHIQHTAPFEGGGGGPGGWGCAIVVVPYMLYKHYHRFALVEKHYPNMQKWIEYMESRSEDGIVVREEKGGWCLGEWCTPEKVALPEPFVNTYFLIKSLDYMVEMGEKLGLDTAPYAEKAQKTRHVFVKTYYSPEDNSFLGGIQGADAFALDLGLGNEKMLRALAEKYDKLGEFDTGIFGTDILIRVLFEGGYPDTALRLLTSEKTNSFGGMMLRGETSLPEYFNTFWGSHNHHMFGAAAVYLFTHLLGIREEGGLFIISPADYTPSLLPEVSGARETRLGRVSVARKTVLGSIIFEIESDFDTKFCFRGEKHSITSGTKNSFSFNE